MAVTLKGGPVKIGGQFLSKGQKAPDFSLADKTRADVTWLSSLLANEKYSIFSQVSIRQHVLHL
jgi:thioredoxin-dependent peroxiredoxin